MCGEPDGWALRVVRGEPTAEQLAALTAALAAVQARSMPNASAAHSPPSARGSAWRDRAALIGAPLRHGPGAWRRSALPR
ncbi:MAG TPA: acyl-CoA carboxylase epsilon subunit [Streptosporangiaceae bacterium]